MKNEEKVKFYESLLITLHTLRWTGNHDRLVKLLDIIGRFSYKHTNSNPGEEYEPDKIFNTLKQEYENLYD